MENVEIKKEEEMKPKMVDAEMERKKKAKKKASKKEVKKVAKEDNAKQMALIAFMKGCNERRKASKLPEAYSMEEIAAEEAKL
jgi:hypothetical protein